MLLEELSVSTIFNHDLLHHLTDDDLEVLVIDFHTLQAVDVLDFIHDVFLDGRWPHDVQNVIRRHSTIRQWHARLDKVVVLNQDVL